MIRWIDTSKWAPWPVFPLALFTISFSFCHRINMSQHFPSIAGFFTPYATWKRVRSIMELTPGSRIIASTRLPTCSWIYYEETWSGALYAPCRLPGKNSGSRRLYRKRISAEIERGRNADSVSLVVYRVWGLRARKLLWTATRRAGFVDSEEKKVINMLMQESSSAEPDYRGHWWVKLLVPRTCSLGDWLIKSGIITARVLTVLLLCEPWLLCGFRLTRSGEHEHGTELTNLSIS